MKFDKKLLWGALGLSALVAGGALARPFVAPDAAPELAAPAPLPRRAIGRQISDVGPLTHSKEAYDFCNDFNRLFEAGEFAAALTLAQKWQAAHPGDPDGFSNLGRAVMIRGDIKGAVSYGKAAVQADARYKPIVAPWLGEATLIDLVYPDLKLAPLAPTTGKSDAVDRALGAQAQTLLLAKKYEEIERVAAQLLASRAELPDGSWKLGSFAQGLITPADGEAAWRANHARLEAWNRARPQSKLARLIVGRSWCEGAWRARGGEFADKVGSDQWATMKQRLRAGAPYLSASLREIKSTPLVFSGLQSWALLGQVPRPVYEGAWKQAVAAFPGYTPFYIAKANFLMARWYGEPGEWEAFAKASADQIGGARGDRLYARVVEDQSEYYGDNFFATNAISYERAKRGFQALIARGADPLSDASKAWRMADLAGDYAYERALFQGELAHAFVPTGDAKAYLSSISHSRIRAFKYTGDKLSPPFRQAPESRPAMPLPEDHAPVS